jgi:hypothetical protein
VQSVLAVVSIVQCSGRAAVDLHHTDRCHGVVQASLKIGPRKLGIGILPAPQLVERADLRTLKSLFFRLRRVYPDGALDVTEKRVDLVAQLGLDVREARRIDQHRAMLAFVSPKQPDGPRNDERPNRVLQAFGQTRDLKSIRVFHGQQIASVFNVPYHPAVFVEKDAVGTDIIRGWIETDDEVPRK